jgi:hypothetical protein
MCGSFSVNQTNMETTYFLAITLVGGILFLFFAVGWSAYKEKKIPETPLLFRWLIAGLVATGLGAYAWIFGAGGNVEEVIKQVGDALASSTETVASVGGNDITIGMPNF